MSRQFRSYTSLTIPLASRLLTNIVFILVIFTTSLLYSPFSFAQTVVDGGLTAPPVPSTLGPNVLTNGNFAAGIAGWTNLATCFAIDPTTLAPNGAATLEMSLSSTCDAPIAVSSEVPSGATYTFSGQIMTDDVMSSTVPAAGAYADLYFASNSPIVNGTTGWQTFQNQHIVIPGTQGPTNVRLQTYDPVTTGDAWFANISVQQEIPPGLQTFLLYPNYRGLMFSDQNQAVSMDLIVTPPQGTALSGLQVELDASDVNWQNRRRRHFFSHDGVHGESGSDRSAGWDLQCCRETGRQHQRQRAYGANALHHRQARCITACGHEGVHRSG
jgi:hypothetical protein